MSELEEKVLERTAALEEQRALLQAVVENIPAGLLVMDQEGVSHTANTEAMRILGAESLDSPIFSDWRNLEVFRLDGSPVELDELPISRTLAGATW